LAHQLRASGIQVQGLEDLAEGIVCKHLPLLGAGGTGGAGGAPAPTGASCALE